MVARYSWHVERWRSLAARGILLGGLVSACSRDVQALTPQQLQQQYGITDAYAGQVATPDGALHGTLVPVTLADGRRAELIIPDRGAGAEHTAFLRDEQGLHPIELQPNTTRDQLVASPGVVSRRAERANRIRISARGKRNC